MQEENIYKSPELLPFEFKKQTSSNDLTNNSTLNSTELRSNRPMLVPSAKTDEQENHNNHLNEQTLMSSEQKINDFIYKITTF